MTDVIHFSASPTLQGQTSVPVTRKSIGALARIVTQPTTDNGTKNGTKDRTRRKRTYKPRARKCKVCGTVFTPKAAHAKCCSAACRNALYRRRQKRGRKPVDKPAVVLDLVTCVHCGRTNLATAGKGAKYCSRSCRQRAWKARRVATVHALMELTHILKEATAADMLDKVGMKRAGELLKSHGWQYADDLRSWIAPHGAMNLIGYSDVTQAFAIQNKLDLSSAKKIVDLLTTEGAAAALESSGWTFDDAQRQWVKQT